MSPSSRPERPRDAFGRPLPRGAADAMADREEPEEVVASAAEAFERAVALFDQQRFFEAHEFFEYVWKSADVPAADRDFWKGVTQVAVGCVHIQRSNAVGAVTLLQRAADHLSGYPTQYHGVNVTTLAEEALALSRRVGQDGVGTVEAFPSFPTAG